MNIQIFKNYSQQGLYRAIDIFNYPNDYPMLSRILGYRFLFQHKDKERRLIPPHNKIVESIKKVVKENNNQQNATVLMELVDILLEFSKKDGLELLEYLRKSKLQAVAKPPPKTNGPIGTIYADSQSVHNSAITKTIKDVAKYLCDNYRPKIINQELKDSIKTKLESNLIFVDNKKILDEVLDRIYNDNAIFEGYNADIILFSLWNWISKQSNDEIYNRVAEELFEMHKYCSTRILSGLINSIQGFTEDDNLIIKMSTEEQCKSVVYNYIDKKIKECKDERVVDGIYDKDKFFLDFVKQIINEKREEWNKEYGKEFTSYVNKNVNKYTQTILY
jgi:hypothetical protein